MCGSRCVRGWRHCICWPKRSCSKQEWSQVLTLMSSDIMQLFSLVSNLLFWTRNLWGCEVNYSSIEICEIPMPLMLSQNKGMTLRRQFGVTLRYEKRPRWNVKMWDNIHCYVRFFKFTENPIISSVSILVENFIQKLNTKFYKNLLSHAKLLLA